LARKIDDHTVKKDTVQLELDNWVDNEKSDKAQDFLDIEHKKSIVQQQDLQLKMLRMKEQDLVD
jgi:hypothetical protein